MYCLYVTPACEARISTPALAKLYLVILCQGQCHASDDIARQGQHRHVQLGSSSSTRLSTSCFEQQQRNRNIHSNSHSPSPSPCHSFTARLRFFCLHPDPHPHPHPQSPPPHLRLSITSATLPQLRQLSLCRRFEQSRLSWAASSTGTRPHNPPTVGGTSWR
jgi:hypothetical protein